MTVLSEAGANAILDASYGPGRAAGMPASFKVHLYTGDPRAGGVALGAAGGYAPVTVPNSGVTWNPASGGTKESEPVVFAASTGAWDADATWWVLTNSTGTMFDGGPLDEVVSVGESMVQVAVVMVVGVELEIS